MTLVIKDIRVRDQSVNLVNLKDQVINRFSNFPLRKLHIFSFNAVWGKLHFLYPFSKFAIKIILRHQVFHSITLLTKLLV